ncbi:MAG: thiol-disulfide isomerase/thioredoxin [Bradymonadia bacterium]|jgi:thiol-disulfide isomerase/thioredoxin
MVPLGSPAPAFDLPNSADGNQTSLSDFSGKPILVMFICNHCPYVIHVMDEIDRLTTEYAGKVDFVAINSNSKITHPQDGPENMKKLAAERGWKFPFCFDETQEVAKAYQAACTPDWFLYDAEHRLFYRGQLDETRPGRGVAHGADLRGAIDGAISSATPPAKQIPSGGCNIKWH